MRVSQTSHERSLVLAVTFFAQVEVALGIFTGALEGVHDALDRAEALCFFSQCLIVLTGLLLVHSNSFKLNFRIPTV